jgi:hypothetical protein
MFGVGALVTLELPADSPVLLLPWIITIGPLSDEEEWDPVVCGPYERAHALALAEEIVADEELMAVVEPVMPHVSVQEIRDEIVAARALAADEEDDDADTDVVDVELDEEDEEGPEYDDEDDDEDEVDVDEDDDVGLDDEDDDEDDEDEDDEEDADADAHAGPPSPEEIRAGFARIAARLSER